MKIAEEYKTLAKAIEEGNKNIAEQQAKELLASGKTAHEIFQDAIVPCLTDIGEQFSRMDIFLPSLILAAEATKAAQVILQEDVEGAMSETLGKIVLGTVFGDVHDIGKDIVAAMLEANGFEVVDLGVNVATKEFVTRARECDADIIAMSSLLSTSVPYMYDVVSLIRDNKADRDRFKIMVGGGPITTETAQDMGADAYGTDAADAVRVAKQLLGKG